MCLFKCPHLASAVQQLLNFPYKQNKTFGNCFSFLWFITKHLLPVLLSDNDFSILVKPKPPKNISSHQTSLAEFDYTVGLNKISFLCCQRSFMSICAPCITEEKNQKELNLTACVDISSHKRFPVRNSLKSWCSSASVKKASNMSAVVWFSNWFPWRRSCVWPSKVHLDDTESHDKSSIRDELGIETFWKYIARTTAHQSLSKRPDTPQGVFSMLFIVGDKCLINRARILFKRNQLG